MAADDHRAGDGEASAGATTSAPQQQQQRQTSRRTYLRNKKTNNSKSASNNLNANGPRPSEEQVARLFCEIDADGDGRLSYDEVSSRNTHFVSCCFCSRIKIFFFDKWMGELYLSIYEDVASLLLSSFLSFLFLAVSDCFSARSETWEGHQECDAWQLDKRIVLFFAFYRSFDS